MKFSQAQYDQTVYIGGRKLDYVTDVDGSYSHTVKPINIFGQGTIKNVVAGIPKGDFSITRTMIAEDFMRLYTGIDSFIRGSINYGDKVFGFNLGSLTSYSYSVVYGEPPTANYGITVYGDIGSGLYIDSLNATMLGNPSSLNALGYNTDNPKKVPLPSTINIICNGSSGNRITSFDLSAQINKNEIYTVNSTTPFQVTTKWPIEVITNFTMEVDDYETKRQSDALITNAFDVFSVNINGVVYEDSEMTTEDGTLLTTEASVPLLILKKNDVNPSTNQVFNFSSSNTRLISEQFTSTTEDVATVKLTYVTYLNKNNNSYAGNYIE
jgi:hypothetical protein